MSSQSDAYHLKPHTCSEKFLPFNRKVCRSSECCGLQICVGSDLTFLRAHVLRGALFVQLILLRSGSRSGTRGPTVVPASSSFPPLYTSPVSSPYAKILLPVLRDLLPCCDFPLSVRKKLYFVLQVILKDWELQKSSQAVK